MESISHKVRDAVFDILDSQETQDRLFKAVLFNPIASNEQEKHL